MEPRLQSTQDGAGPCAAEPGSTLGSTRAVGVLPRAITSAVPDLLARWPYFLTYTLLDTFNSPVGMVWGYPRRGQQVWHKAVAYRSSRSRGFAKAKTGRAEFHFGMGEGFACALCVYARYNL